MKTIAVVPVKRLSQAKTRLAGVLSPEERTLLALDMLSHVLGSLAASGVVENVAVISPQPDELHLPPGITPIVQERDGLNNLLEQGRDWAELLRADALLVLFADLPALASSDIYRMVALGERTNTIVLAPDRHGNGTNAMLAHPAALARFAFGEGSFQAHRVAALQAGAHVEIYRSIGTSLDIDTLDDLDHLNTHRVATAMEYAFSG